MSRQQKRAGLRLMKRNLDLVQKGELVVVPTRGFGITFTNKQVAILCWSRVFNLWLRKFDPAP